MYTKEYVNKNKVAIRCKDEKEKLEVVKLLTSVEKVHFGNKRGEDIKPKDVNFGYGSIVARYDTSGNGDYSICETNGNYWENNGYIEITGEQFLQDNNILENYEIY